MDVPAKRRAEKLLLGLGAAIFTFGALAIGPQLLENVRLDFQHASPYVRIDGELVEVFTLHPKESSPLSSAGVSEGDIVVSHSISGFYAMLRRAKGGTAVFEVVDGGDGAPLGERHRRTIRLDLPR